MPREKLEDTFTALRKQLGGAKANSLGVTKARIEEVLKSLDRYTPDAADAVYALLDDTLPSFFGSLSQTHHFSDGATTAQLGCHVGILQRGKGKLDREGRDYWIKPLREVGAIEPITLPKGATEFVSGHITAKSPASAYRLTPDFVQVLTAKARELGAKLKAWASEDAIRDRLTMQAKAAADSKALHSNEHEALIEAILDYYVPAFLPAYECIYVDSDDGDRVGPEESKLLKAAGIALNLDDAYPDVIMFDAKARAIWCVESVTSDGEVDQHKVDNLLKLCERSKLKLAGLTTAYRTWRDAYRRQSKHKNLAPGTYLWIQESGGTQLKVLPPEPPRK